MADNTPQTLKPGGIANNQQTPAAGSDGVNMAQQSIDKGGMRGVGLLLVMLAEAALKKKSVDIAQDYLKENQREYANFVRIHQGAIKQTVAEAMSPYDNPTYRHDFYAAASAGMAKSSVIDKQWFETRRRVHRYATGLQARVDFDFAVARMHGIMAGWFMGRRYEMAYADEHNNRQFDRKLEAANIGLGVGNIVRQSLATAVNNLSGAYDNIGDTIAVIGNGYAKREGYKDGRSDAKSAFKERTRHARGDE